MVVHGRLFGLVHVLKSRLAPVFGLKSAHDSQYVKLGVYYALAASLIITLNS